jgi:hypothetical protein
MSEQHCSVSSIWAAYISKNWILKSNTLADVSKQPWHAIDSRKRSCLGPSDHVGTDSPQEAKKPLRKRTGLPNKPPETTSTNGYPSL